MQGVANIHHGEGDIIVARFDSPCCSISPFHLHLSLTSCRDEFLVATDHQSSLLVSPRIPLDRQNTVNMLEVQKIFTMSAYRKWQHTSDGAKRVD